MTVGGRRPSTRYHNYGRPSLLSPTPDWTVNASCAELDLQTVDRLFFPLRDNRAVKEAKAICGECPVVEPCLALGMLQPEGIFGGKTHLERDVIRGHPIVSSLAG